MKVFFGCLALCVLCVVGEVRSDEVQKNPADSLADLKILSDSLQVQLIASIEAGDVASYRSLIPDGLGIVWPGGQSLTGFDAKNKYDSAFMAIFAGSEIITERQSIEAVIKVAGYVKELCRFEVNVPVDDSTTQSYTGHLTNYWEWKDDAWHWRRIFLSQR